MIQRDYVQRMIEALSKVLGALMGLKPPEGIDLIQEASRDHLNIEGDWLDNLPKETLIKTLQKEKGLHVGQLEFLAELLAKEGALHFEMEAFSKAKNKLEKALILFDFVDKEWQIFSFERQSTVLKIKTLLREIEAE